ncbi:MAG TPA: hypothetical protein VEL07_21870 [Planctomycetota bacterium]|nr:hypothetical protein [Planctomycetota bacterium]
MATSRWTARVDHALTHTLPAEDLGWRGLLPRPVLADTADADAVRVTLRTRRSDGGIVAQAVVTNRGRRRLRVRAIRWVRDLRSVEGGQALRFPRAERPWYFATENFRGDFYGTGTTRGDCFFKPMPNETVVLGMSEDAVFPGLFVGSATRQRGLFCAAASRERLHTAFRLYGGDGGGWNFEIEEQPTGVDALTIAPGASLRGEMLFFAIVDTADPQLATDGYYRLLERDGAFARRRHNPLPRQRIWGSWNFGLYQNIDEEVIARQLPLLRERFPSVRFVQVDDGYQRWHPTGQRAQIDFLYGAAAGYDEKKFPSGPSALVRRIKAAGLRPATWLGLWCGDTSPMVADHPDWVLRDDLGRPVSFFSTAMGGKPGVGLAVLDPSVPGFRRYIERMCATMFGRWGFEGVKLDFYSFAFQHRRVRFRNGGTSAEHYAWLVDTFRRWLPRDGFLGLCSATGTGTPFTGGADYFRTAEDISDGDWEMARRIALWSVNTGMLLRRAPAMPNIDSIGWSERFGEIEWRSFLDLCVMTGGVVEIAGDLARLPIGRVARMNRVLELSDHTRLRRCLDIPVGPIASPPTWWIAEGRRDTLVGVFNWSDRARAIATEPFARAGGDERRLKPVWEDSPLPGGGSIRLPAHGSAIYRHPRLRR